MINELTTIEIPVELKKVIALSRRAIEEKNLMKFYYESRSGNKGERIIRPYMIIPRGEILELVGTPINELIKAEKKSSTWTLQLFSTSTET